MHRMHTFHIHTGHAPAVLGVDLLNYTSAVNWHDGTPEHAIQWCVIYVCDNVTICSPQQYNPHKMLLYILLLLYIHPSHTTISLITKAQCRWYSHMLLALVFPHW